MKKLLAVANGGMPAPLLRTTFTLLLGMALGSGFWLATLPMAKAAAQMTPAEMIQSKLPTGKTIATATDAELMEGVCKSIRQWPKEAPLIVRTAAGAKKNLRSDILCMAVRCAREKHVVDCSWITDILRDWIKEDPSDANRLTEMGLQCAPDCRDALQASLGQQGEGSFANPPSNINAPPGSVGGGAGGNVCIVCHNGTEVQIGCADVSNYLSSHPGDTAGPCGTTPITNP
jgi:hypothetical protein